MKQDATKLLRKSLDIMELFLKDQDEMTLSEMAQLSGLNKATVYRIASTLIERGYLNQREKRGKYALGAIYLNYSKIVKSRIQPRNIALPYINSLVQKVNECVNLALVKGPGVLFTETFRPQIQVRNTLQVLTAEEVGTTLHGGSLGKIILASMEEAELEKYINIRGLEQYTPHTITRKDELKKHLTMIRQEGIAYDCEELTLGVNSLAAGLRDSEGKVIGAIGIVAPSVRLSRARTVELAPEVKNCAARISKELGYRG
jgi:IclR family transcriptional regulator, KDG regulon repressor